jgi:hypothetical protein
VRFPYDPWRRDVGRTPSRPRPRCSGRRHRGALSGDRDEDAALAAGLNGSEPGLVLDFICRPSAAAMFAALGHRGLRQLRGVCTQASSHPEGHVRRPRPQAERRPYQSFGCDTAGHADRPSPAANGYRVLAATSGCNAARPAFRNVSDLIDYELVRRLIFVGFSSPRSAGSGCSRGGARQRLPHGPAA